MNRNKKQDRLTSDMWEVVEAHPLIVIDPRSMTWDGRIPTAEEFTTWAEAIGAGEFETGILRIADALRDLPAPLITPPKPDEPQGLGAVVEDVEGRRFVHVGSDDDWCVADDETEATWLSWHNIAAVRVLSEGWSE